MPPPDYKFQKESGAMVVWRPAARNSATAKFTVMGRFLVPMGYAAAPGSSHFNQKL